MTPIDYVFWASLTVVAIIVGLASVVMGLVRTYAACAYYGIVGSSFGVLRRAAEALGWYAFGLLLIVAFVSLSVSMVMA